MFITDLRKAFYCFALFALGVASSAVAGPEPMSDYSKEKNPIVEPAPVCDPKWYISIGGGIDLDYGGTHVTDNFSADFFVDTDLTGFAFASAEFHKHDWGSAFDNAWRIQGELGYVLTPHLEVFGLFKYAAADGGSVGGDDLFFDLGFPVFETVDVPVRTHFGDYESWGGELGFRFFFLPKESHFRPYVAFSGGATHVDDINVTMRGDFTGTFGGSSDEIIYQGDFFHDSWVATGAAMLGVEANFACHWSVGVEGGVRYESRLGADDGDFDGDRLIGDPSFLLTPVEQFHRFNNNSGDRLSCPVNGYVKFRF